MSDFPRQFIDIDPVDPTKVYRYKELDSSGNWTGTYRYFQYDPGELNSTPTSLNRAWMQPVEDAIDDLYANIPTVNFVDYYNIEQYVAETAPTVLSVARGFLASSLSGDESYALFGGGQSSSSSLRTEVDAYNTSLVRSTPTALSVARTALAADKNANYALFGGGQISGGYTGVVDAYNNSLVRSTPTALSSTKYLLAAAHTGDYVLFAGGYNGSDLAAVDAYNLSLVKTTPTALSVARWSVLGVSINGYALFGGGYGAASVKGTVDAYNSSLVRTTPSVFERARYNHNACATDSYAIFAGGYDGAVYGVYGCVEVYNASLVKQTSLTFSGGNVYNGYGTGASRNGNKMLMAFPMPYDIRHIMYIFYENLTQSQRTSSFMDCSGMQMAPINNRVVCAGSRRDSTVYATAYSYIYQYSSSIDVPPWYNYKFHDHANEQFTRDGTTLEYTVKATGYIKPAVKTLTGLNA